MAYKFLHTFTSALQVLVLLTLSHCFSKDDEIYISSYLGRRRIVWSSPLLLVVMWYNKSGGMGRVPTGLVVPNRCQHELVVLISTNETVGTDRCQQNSQYWQVSTDLPVLTGVNGTPSIDRCQQISQYWHVSIELPVLTGVSRLPSIDRCRNLPVLTGVKGTPSYWQEPNPSVNSAVVPYVYSATGRVPGCCMPVYAACILTPWIILAVWPGRGWGKVVLAM